MSEFDGSEMYDEIDTDDEAEWEQALQEVDSRTLIALVVPLMMPLMMLLLLRLLLTLVAVAR